MTLDIKLSASINNALKMVDQILADPNVKPGTFEHDVIDKVHRQFIISLHTARHNNEDPMRVAGAIALLCADFITEYVMFSVPPYNGNLVQSIGQEMINEVATHMNELLGVYVGGAPPQPDQQH